MNFDPPKRYRFPACGSRQIRFFKKFPSVRWFEYHCWESEESSDSNLWHHTHQKYKVLRRLMPNESDYEMYEVRFQDGFTYIVFADELLTSVKQFQRPDYRD